MFREVKTSASLLWDYAIGSVLRNRELYRIWSFAQPQSAFARLHEGYRRSIAPGPFFAHFARLMFSEAGWTPRFRKTWTDPSRSAREVVAVISYIMMMSGRPSPFTSATLMS